MITHILQITEAQSGSWVFAFVHMTKFQKDPETDLRLLIPKSVCGLLCKHHGHILSDKISHGVSPSLKQHSKGFPGGSVVKNLPASAADTG